MTGPHQKFADELRALADFYERNPDTATPGMTGTALEYFTSLPDMLSRALALGGTWTADNPVTGRYFNLTLHGTPPGYRYQLYCDTELVGAAVETTETVTRTEFVIHNDVTMVLRALQQPSTQLIDTLASAVDAVQA